MRSIVQLTDARHASLFGDYLQGRDIDNTVEANDDGTWEVWVHSEDELDQAKALLADFQKDPERPEFKKVASKADKKRQRKRKEEEEARKRMIDATQMWSDTRKQPHRLTLGLILISVLLSLLGGLGRNMAAIDFLLMSDYVAVGGPWWYGLKEISEGQVWRLITPIFLHFGVLHLLFNMLWLRDLGGMVETRKGPIFFAVMILILAVLSNLTQYALAGPRFGGMSGVVYGLLGYIWIKGRYDPGAGLRLHSSTVTMMIVWYFLCLTGLLGPIANGAHTAGLVVGVVWGYFGSGAWKRHFGR